MMRKLIHVAFGVLNLVNRLNLQFTALESDNSIYNISIIHTAINQEELPASS